MSVPAALRPVSRLLHWWGEALLTWLPARWRRQVAGGERLVLLPYPQHWALRHVGVDGARELGRLPMPLPVVAEGMDPLAGVLSRSAARLPRWLVLPAQAGLQRALPVPGAARGRLREVLGFEIERQTPFAADAVLHDARVLEVRPDGSLQAELVVLPRTQLEPVLQGLGMAAGQLHGIDLAGPDGVPLGVNLLEPAQRRVVARPWRLGLWLTLAALVLTGLALTRVLDNRRAAADALQQQVQARAAKARAVSVQRQALVDAVEGASWLQQQRAGRPTAIEVLDALSRGLPDGTYVDKVAIEGGRLTVIGLSGQAASLVGRLQGARQPWRNPALSGALQPDPATRLDRFTLVAELQAPAGAATAAAGGSR